MMPLPGNAPGHPKKTNVTEVDSGFCDAMRIADEPPRVNRDPSTWPVWLTLISHDQAPPCNSTVADGFVPLAVEAANLAVEMGPTV